MARLIGPHHPQITGNISAFQHAHANGGTTMNLTRVSIVSGEEQTMDIPMLREEDYEVWHALGEARPYVQDAFPLLKAEEREFMINGVTPEEWNDIFGDEPE